MSRIILNRSLLMLPLAAVLLLSVACGSDPTQPVVVGVEPEVVNDTDAFQFQVSSVQGYTGTYDYAWNNTGTLANIDQSSAVAAGQAVLVLLDANGAEVYSQDLAVDGSFATSAGMAGGWQVRVVLTGMTGTLNFRAEKRTP